MFDRRAGGPDPATTLSLVAQAHRTAVEQECRLVTLAAHWADLHHPDGRAPAEKPLPGAEQGRQFGCEGTPEVLEFATAELGAQTETSSAIAPVGIDLKVMDGRYADHSVGARVIKVITRYLRSR